MTYEGRAQRLLDAVPSCLRDRPQWVCWRLENRNSKPTKCPYDANTGNRADSTAPKTWATVEQAVGAWNANPNYNGVGFVFSSDDPFCGIDLDKCIDPGSNELKPWARSIIDQLQSYSEISPSGHGVKLVVEAHKPGPRCKKKFYDGSVEIYDRDRFFTITGNHLPSTPITICQRQNEVDALYAMIFPAKPSPKKAIPAASGNDAVSSISDEEILARARRCRKSGVKFANLWNGQWDGFFSSQSEADSSLVFKLAFYTKDASQLDRLFRGSGLMRDKWDEKRGGQTYGEITIAKALEKVTEQYRPRTVRTKHLGTVADAPSVDVSESGPIELGQRDPQSGRLVLSPSKTLPTAKAFIDEHYIRSDHRSIQHYAGSFLAWHGNRYVSIEDEYLRQQLQTWLHKALRYQVNARSGESKLVDFDSNPRTVTAALDTLRAYAHLNASISPPQWLDYRQDLPSPKDLLPFPSGCLDLNTSKVLPPDPRLFNINAIDFEYSGKADRPVQWFRFLDQLWAKDVESIELLQEWMGYSLVADTSQQKILLMVGPRRSGKGTIGRILTRLAGAGNVVGPTTSSLGGPFGLQPLLGKSLAIVSDARFTGDNIGVVIERLLCISGEDMVTVDRKFLGSVTMKLPTRFVFLTNELPRLNDASGALAGRFMILRFTNSFYGQEDMNLTAKLSQELPGILLWAIDGLKRLRARRHFHQPRTSEVAVQELEHLASPVLAFVHECCEVRPGVRITVDDLYEAWRRWCVEDGRTTISTRQVFGRDLAAAVPSIVARRNHDFGRFYDGITLR